MLSSPKPLDEIQPNLVCELLTWMGCATAFFFGHAPWGPGEGSKGQISFNFNYKVNFLRFLYQTLCVFSQMKDTKHIRRDFHSVAWAMPQGSDLGALGVLRWSKKKIQTWSCGISNQRGWWAEENASKIFILGPNWEPWGEVKRSNIIKFQLPCQFQRFLYQTLCVLTYKRKYIEPNFYSVAGAMHQG